MVLLTHWGVPRGIISDRDPKFISKFWQGLFRRLDTKLLVSTAWHPQTDGLSERKNQTTEIAIRHQTFEQPDLPWTSGLISLQL
jgi:hypothetical protein